MFVTLHKINSIPLLGYMLHVTLPAIQYYRSCALIRLFLSPCLSRQAFHVISNGFGGSGNLRNCKETIHFFVCLFLFITSEKAFCMYLIFAEHNGNCLKFKAFLFWKPSWSDSALLMHRMQWALWVSRVKQWGAAFVPKWEPFYFYCVTKLSRELCIGAYVLCSIAVSNLWEIWCFQVVIWTHRCICVHTPQL